MQSFNFDLNAPNEDRHVCVGHREGEWIVFTCPICKDYERRINTFTGKMISNVGENPIMHFGSHVPFKVVQDTFSQS